MLLYKGSYFIVHFYKCVIEFILVRLVSLSMIFWLICSGSNLYALCLLECGGCLVFALQNDYVSVVVAVCGRVVIFAFLKKLSFSFEFYPFLPLVYECFCW